MKNLKPFILGCIAGSTAMILGLQYHVVHSHEGLQLVPRAPQSTLGLAWVDVRDWDAKKWSDRPALARALVAHGSSHLISESIASRVGYLRDPDAGTIGYMRSLLNDPLSFDFDAPLFGSDDALQFGTSIEDSLAIPFTQETRHPQRDELFSDTTHRDQLRKDFANRTPSWLRNPNSGFNEYEPGSAKSRPVNNGRLTRDRLSESNERHRSYPFSQTEFSWQPESRSGASSWTNADARVRETTILEDLLFPEEEALKPVPGVRGRGLDSLTRGLDLRKSQAQERASSGFYADSNDLRSSAGGAISRYVRDRNRSGLSSKDTIRVEPRDSVPHAIRAFREGFDPFLD